jgi:hypothetical protein
MPDANFRMSSVGAEDEHVILPAMTVRRWMSAVLVLAIAFAPALLEVCQVTCAMHTSPSAASADAMPHAHTPSLPATASTREEHSCHQPLASASEGPCLEAIPHRCGHADALPITCGAVAQVIVHAPAVLPAPLYLPNDLSRAQATPSEAPPYDPVPISLNLPLRV